MTENSTFFTLWFDHYKSTETPGSFRKVTVGVTNNELHVMTRDGEYYLTLDEVINSVIENGEWVKE